jgi:hypothetical protein
MLDLHVQLVTSAFREIPKSWSQIPGLTVVISVDGLQPEHDARRKPATYERILKNIQGHAVTIHCTVTAQMLQRTGYLGEFLAFWSAREEARRVWMSFFTPQRGASDQEILSPEQRLQTVRELLRLRELFPKLDMPPLAIREFLHPPSSPEECIFAQTTNVISADLTSKITPCQFGGDPDCSQCGCMASMGLAAVGHRRLIPGITAGNILNASIKIGHALRPLTKKRIAKSAGPGTLTQITLQRNGADAKGIGTPLPPAAHAPLGEGTADEQTRSQVQEHQHLNSDNVRT